MEATEMANMKGERRRAKDADIPKGKRLFDPAFTSDFVHVPHLQTKIGILGGHHPRIKHQKHVARELKVQESTLSTWISGMKYRDEVSIATSNPECIPVLYYPSFLEIYGLPAAIMELADLTEFRQAVATFEAGLGPWVKLVQALPDGATIEIIAANATRGLIDPDGVDDPGVLQLRAGDEIMIRAPNPGLCHGAMLLQDRLSWSCLRPSPRFRETEVEGDMVFPRQIPNEPPRFAKLEAIGGIHRAVMIFTAETLPSSVLEVLLARPLDSRSLNSIVPILNSLLASGSCRMLSRRFLVAVRGN
jgi:hypothetical protein